jgi:glycerol-1-phosphate dehydrogenase [NAD(P)+]
MRGPPAAAAATVDIALGSPVARAALARYTARVPSGLSSVDVPALVRIKPGALDRLGVYLERARWSRVALIRSAGLPAALEARLRAAIAGVDILLDSVEEVPSLEAASRLLAALPQRCQAVVAFGGGRALDLAKHTASIAGLPFLAVPTSLSHDGFASPIASLHTQRGRRSIGCRPPAGVIIDTAVCFAAPRLLWLAGLGDVAAKVTAVADWKLAFHARGEPVNDLAALLSDATVFQLAARPVFDLEGTRLLATALLLNGVSMSLAGTSRPASGSEHLISHALDQLSARPRLHGLQVGIGAYIVAHLQGQGQARVSSLLETSGFLDAVAGDPFSRAEWLAAIEQAPRVKDDFYTVLSTRDVSSEAERLMRDDPRLAPCFID